MSADYVVGIGSYHLGWGKTPRAALRRFWREVWSIGLEAITRPESERSWLEGVCIQMAFESDLVRWHRAVAVRLGEGSNK